MGAGIPKILIATRDVGAASHFASLIMHVKSNNICEVVCYSQEPALTYLSSHGIDTCEFPYPVLKNDAGLILIEAQKATKGIIEVHNPDVILIGGACGGEIGFEELLLQCETDLPRILYQDYWGDFNRSAGEYPDAFLVLDDYASEVTQEMYAVDTHIVGPLKYYDYNKLDFDQIRDEFRSALLVDAGVKLIGYFGQSLSFLDGYQHTIDAFVEEIVSLRENYNIELLFKPHPRESSISISRTFSRFENSGIKTHLVLDNNVLAPLISSDLVVSCFSTCAFDLLYINFFSDKPLSNAMYLMFDGDVRDFYFESTKLANVPLIEQGFVTGVNQREELSVAIDYSLSKVGSNAMWLKSKKLTSPENNIENCLFYLGVK